MAKKRGYALSTGAGLFVDEETGLKIVPGQVVEIDQAEAGQRTLLAIRHGGLVETDLPTEKSEKTEKKGKDSGETDPPKE